MSTIEEIQRDLACPQCEYNLRGLQGAIVTCPECGRECDVAKMVSQRWTQPWHKAPGLSTIYSPTAWFVLVGVFVSPCLLGAAEDWMARAIILAAVAAGWVGFMARAWTVFRTNEGIKLAAVSHVIFAAYIAGVVPIIGTLLIAAVAVLARERDRVSIFWFVVLLVLIPLGIFLINVGRRGERYIAERCIRQYLNRPPRS